VRSRVSSRHPSQELSIVDDEIGKRELMRVEQEWRDAQTDDGDPKVDNVRHKHTEGDVQQQH
jgi:hypothetical protein